MTLTVDAKKIVNFKNMKCLTNAVQQMVAHLFWTPGMASAPSALRPMSQLKVLHHQLPVYAGFGGTEL